MTRSARGTREAPGRYVGQKAGLNRRFSPRAGVLVTRLEHKAPARVVKVKAAYTSQRCSACGILHRQAREPRAFPAPILRLRRQRRCEHGPHHRIRGTACPPRNFAVTCAPAGPRSPGRACPHRAARSAPAEHAIRVLLPAPTSSLPLLRR
ncbi:zinc ribbon domain-containing protein [Nonomuraea sp. KM90]|uniref:zinc ribbon domain-containing protein n=1 Tax=Nonomuraea sp. KM90 TaxID=3457428 RepID=UPI003FCD5D77